ncbi:MAG: transposase [Promethearchaeota archaeon]
MLSQKTLPKHYNELHNQLLNLFHSSGMPMHFNKTGNKEFTNCQRISLIILLRRSKKSLRDFVEELKESLWVKWLGLKRIPGKSTLHDWINLFKMKTIRELFSLIKPKKSELTAIDGTGLDSWQRSRHYEKRANKIGDLPHMPYAKLDIFIDVKNKMLIDFDLKTSREHDAKVAKRIFRRNNLNGIKILADKGYDSEPLHGIVREKGGIMYAPPRKKWKTSLRKYPRGANRKRCLNLPEFMGQRSIVESVNFSLKKKQITALSCKKEYMKKREFAWHAILYNIRIIINNKKGNSVGEATELGISFFLLKIEIYVFPDSAP